MRTMVRAILVSVLLSSAGAAPRLAAQSVGPAMMPDFLGERAHEAPSRLAADALAAPLAQLSAAAVGAPDELAAVAAWNAAGRQPAKNGFTRHLPLPQRVRLAAAAASGAWDGGALARRADGGLVWGTRVDVAASYRLRLHLTGVALPAGAKLWVWSGGETRGPFGAEIAGAAGEIWTPSVRGGSIWLEVALPADAAGAVAGGYGFVVSDVMELVDTSPRRLASDPRAATTSCLVDAGCVTAAQLPPIAQYRAAVSSLEFVEGGNGFLCTGSLLNNSRADFTPYLLTANHCIASQAVASTLDAVWDYFDASCRGSFPDRAALPASHGASLLSTGLGTDYTLLQLSSLPSGRAFLGWNANTSAVSDGTAVYRLSHPAPAGFPFPQTYSTSVIHTTGIHQCSDADGRPVNDLNKFLHSVAAVGAPFPGSSGAPAVNADGQVVGQLLGTCPGTTEPCVGSGAFDQLDGAFWQTYDSIHAWLTPTVSITGPCLQSTDAKLCIDDAPGDGRFQVTVAFEQAGGTLTPGHSIPLNTLGISAGGLFWFFSPANPEMLVKVLNGCSLGGHYWVFLAAGTDVGLSTTVTDTVSGRQRTYTNSVGNAALSILDTSALPCS